MKTFVIAPDGKTPGAVPEDQFPAVLAAGGSLVTEDQLADRNQRLSMAVRAFEEEQKRKRPKAFSLRRKPYRG